MNVEQERSRSLWMEIPPQRFGRLESDLATDVLVVGSGIAGLSTAYELALLGRKVTVIDRGRIGRGMTARTTAHLTFGSDDYFKTLGEARGRLWFESQRAAVDRIERICREEGLEADFARIPGVLFAADDAHIGEMKDELKAAHEVGFTSIEWREDGGRFGVAGPVMVYPDQARFHPLKYLMGLARVLADRGVELYEDTPAIDHGEENGLAWVKTEDGRRIEARQVVFATNTPVHLKLPIHTKQAPYRTYAFAAPAPKGAVPDVLLWDTARPGYHYVRLQPGEAEDMVIVGGEDHKSGTEDDGDARIMALEEWARGLFPQLGEIAYAWSGQVYEPADAVGFIGKSPRYEQTFMVTGDSGQGITTGVVASLLLRDLMSGWENDWKDLYEPSRMMTHGLGEFVKENVEATRHWAELIAKREVGSVDEILPGAGALARIDGKPVAAYRDLDGALHLNSAVCPHAGCVVHWNGFEGCWDCPCHGSQFDVDGEVLNGPAVTALSPVEAPAERRQEAPPLQTWQSPNDGRVA